MKGFMKHIRIPTLNAHAIRALALGTFCALGAFAVGIETAGDVHPFARSEAALQEIVGSFGPVRGDANGNGALDSADAYIVYQAAKGLAVPTAEQVRRGDMDDDGILTENDLNRILYTLSLL